MHLAGPDGVDERRAAANFFPCPVPDGPRLDGWHNEITELQKECQWLSKTWSYSLLRPALPWLCLISRQFAMAQSDRTVSRPTPPRPAALILILFYLLVS